MYQFVFQICIHRWHSTVSFLNQILICSCWWHAEIRTVFSVRCPSFFIYYKRLVITPFPWWCQCDDLDWYIPILIDIPSVPQSRLLPFLSRLKLFPALIHHISFDIPGSLSAITKIRHRGLVCISPMFSYLTI